MPFVFPHVPVSSETRHHLFLSFKESLTNILKHSDATEVHVFMEAADSQFSIRVTDNGKGMDGKFNESDFPEADGLANMQTRLGTIGGACRIESSFVKGMTITFSIPLQKPL